MRVSVEAVRVSIEALRCFRGRERLEEVPENVNWGHESVLSRPLLTLSQPLKHSQGLQLACNREFTSTFSRLWECCWGRESVVYSLFCNSLIEGFGSGSIPLTNGSGSGRKDPDPDIDRNESTNVPISKLIIETKPKRFDVFPNLKWNVSVYCKNFGTKPKLFDVFQLLFCKRKTFLFFQKNLEQNQNFLMCFNFFWAKAKRY